MYIKLVKKYIVFLLTVFLLPTVLTACETKQVGYGGEVNISLSDSIITVNGRKIENQGAVYASNDIVYYEDLDYYASGNKYGAGTQEEKHAMDKAHAATVVNITKAGVYRVRGSLSQGQIRVDLGEKSRNDKSDVVTLILDGVDINCDVAPAVLFMNAYECDGHSNVKMTKKNVDTSGAGANIVIADGSINNICGSHVAKIFKDRVAEKKLWKQDGAVYSYVSLNINGEEENSGILNITADKEGISSELHCTINGGNINITAMDDGINVNEDRVSAVTINGGVTHIIAGMSPIGGDGIDSNGWLVMNGGTLVSVGYQKSDTGVDNENGLYINGGTLVSLGHYIDYTQSDSEQKTFNLKFKNEFSSDNAIIITDTQGKVIFCYDASEDDVVKPYISPRQGVMIASSDFVIGETYNLYMGGSVDGENYMGVYDISTVKGFKGAVKQMHHSDEQFNRWSIYENGREKYDPDVNFVFDDTVNCFADITDYTE